ncbi:probable serine/threonine-protein kinase DDB_G0272282 [Littorina saxatilis]|uniref:WAP domain-containing protein n=1 Tax=Littorina saxatilis TaxID=31220 RepID=A0AAN9BKK5_9CAEN
MKFLSALVLVALISKASGQATCANTICSGSKQCRIIERCTGGDCQVGTICVEFLELPLTRSNYQCAFDDPVMRVTDGGSLNEISCGGNSLTTCPTGTSCVDPPGVCCTGASKGVGTCPSNKPYFNVLKGGCSTFCRHDQECPGYQLCCSTGVGCRTCMDPSPRVTCETHQCNPGTHCMMAESTCTSYPCFAAPKCVADKAGTCPMLGMQSTCVDQCQVDSHCEGDKKCCSRGGCNVCISPSSSTPTPAPPPPPPTSTTASPSGNLNPGPSDSGSNLGSMGTGGLGGGPTLTNRNFTLRDIGLGGLGGDSSGPNTASAGLGSDTTSLNGVETDAAGPNTVLDGLDSFLGSLQTSGATTNQGAPSPSTGSTGFNPLSSMLPSTNSLTSNSATNNLTSNTATNNAPKMTNVNPFASSTNNNPTNTNPVIPQNPPNPFARFMGGATNPAVNPPTNSIPPNPNNPFASLMANMNNNNMNMNPTNPMTAYMNNMNNNNGMRPATNNLMNPMNNRGNAMLGANNMNTMNPMNTMNVNRNGGSAPLNPMNMFNRGFPSPNPRNNFAPVQPPRMQQPQRRQSQQQCGMMCMMMMMMGT